MKRKLDTKAWTALDAALQALYKKVEGKDHNYELSLEDDDDDDDDSHPAVRAKNREKARAQAAEQKLKEASDELKALKKAAAEADDDKARGKGDVATLEASWRKKVADLEADLKSIIKDRENDLRAILVDREADAMAREISTTPKAMSRLIKDRLTIEIVDGKTFLRVLDSNGKPSAMTPAELKKEIMSDKDLSGMIIGSRASGGGASGGAAVGGGAFKLADYQNEDKSVNWTKVAAADKESPGVLKQIKAALGQGASPATDE